MIHRLCYISKLDESVFKGDFEKEMTLWTTNVCVNQEEHEIPIGEGEQLWYGGFAIVLGPWCVHLFEAEETVMKRYLTKLQAKNEESGSYYSNIWVMHYTEDVPTRTFQNWNCKSINTSSATREIKSLPDFEKVCTIYESMLKIG